MKSVTLDILWGRVTCQAGNTLQVSSFPVTVGQFRRFVEAGGYKCPVFWSRRGQAWLAETGAGAPSFWGQIEYCGDESLAVTGVSFWEAEAFANWVGGRLPTESEWHWIASNGGNDKYPWGDGPPTHEKCQFTSFLQQGRVARVDAHPAGASKYEIYDLIGNVCEWCYPGCLDTLADNAVTAVLKGGASWHTAENLGPDFRDAAALTRRDNDTGIRLVKGGVLTLGTRPPTSSLSPVLAESVSGRAYARPTTAFRQEELPSAEAFSAWQLVIDGAVKQVRRFTLEGGGRAKSLDQEFEVVEDAGMLTCVCKWCAYVRVKGVRIADVIRSVGLTADPSELFLNFTSLPGQATGKCYETSWNLSTAHSHNALLVFELNGRKLSVEDGSPLRTMDFHTFGYKHVKALARITVSTAAAPGWWEESKGYSFDGTIKSGTYTLAGDPARKLTIFDEGRIKINDSQLATIGYVGSTN